MIPRCSIKDINASRLLHAANTKNILRWMPLRHEGSQPSTRVIVVANGVLGSGDTRALLLGGAGDLQVSLVIDIQGVGHVSSHKVLARGREESTVHG